MTGLAVKSGGMRQVTNIKAFCLFLPYPSTVVLIDFSLI
jgi:hypothetical protein